MDILIIGGTTFLGPALVAEALARGHRLTLFNRGLSNQEAFAGVEMVRGNRETDLHQVAGRKWDAVIDTCGYFPRQLKLSAEALSKTADHYTFVSTLSVYPMYGAPNRDESAEVLTMEDETADEITNETYGPLKVLCEEVVRSAFLHNSLIIRSGLIVGPRDPTNRFTYWVTRAARGGEAIAPPAEQPIQFVDARDLAAFTIRQVEARSNGTFNVTGPAQGLTFGNLLPLIKAALGNDVSFHHASDEFLSKNEVGEFMELPLWVNAELAESFMTFNFDKAQRGGLAFRPLTQTIRDTYEWALAQPADVAKPANLPPEKELKLLAAIRS